MPYFQSLANNWTSFLLLFWSQSASLFVEILEGGRVNGLKGEIIFVGWLYLSQKVNDLIPFRCDYPQGKFNAVLESFSVKGFGISGIDPLQKDVEAAFISDGCCNKLPHTVFSRLKIIETYDLTVPEVRCLT